MKKLDTLMTWICSVFGVALGAVAVCLVYNFFTNPLGSFFEGFGQCLSAGLLALIFFRDAPRFRASKANDDPKADSYPAQIHCTVSENHPCAYVLTYQIADIGDSTTENSQQFDTLSDAMIFTQWAVHVVKRNWKNVKILPHEGDEKKEAEQ